MSPSRAWSARQPSTAAFGARGCGLRQRLPWIGMSDVRGSVHPLLGDDRRRMAGFCIWAPRALVALAMSAGMLMGFADRSGAAERDRGAQIAAVCASCHRVDGRDHGIPSIIGLDEATLVAEMRAFKSGERPSQIMRIMSLSLTAEDFTAVARYLAAQRKDTNPR